MSGGNADNQGTLGISSAHMATGWHTPEGYPPGIEQKILSGKLDEGACTGHRTRLLRFLPGAFTTKPFVHDYWEEVYLLSGDLIVGGSTAGGITETFAANTYACRPPRRTAWAVSLAWRLPSARASLF